MYVCIQVGVVAPGNVARTLHQGVFCVCLTPVTVLYDKSFSRKLKQPLTETETAANTVSVIEDGVCLLCLFLL